MAQAEKTLLILGTRGIPASHGGFETFAERYALYLAERGWDVSAGRWHAWSSWRLPA